MSYKGTITNLKTHFIRAHLDEQSMCDPVDSSDLETTVVTKVEAENDNADSYPVKRKVNYVISFSLLSLPPDVLIGGLKHVLHFF